MKIIKWAAVMVTALFVLMNLGALPQEEMGSWDRVAAVLLALVGLVAVIGVVIKQPWGQGAIVAAGVLNLVNAVVGLAADKQGAVIGIVVGALGAALGGLISLDRTTDLSVQG